MRKQYVLIDKYLDLVFTCDHLYEATTYARHWKAEHGDEVYIYVMERFY